MKDRKLVIHGAGVGVAAGLSLLAWCFCFAPALHASGNYRALLNELATAKERENRAVSDVHALEAQVHVMQQELAARPLTLQAPDAVSQRLQQITELAQGAQFELETQESGKQDVYDRYGTVELQITGRCRAPAVQAFLAALSKRLPDVAVVSIEMSGRYSGTATVPSVAMKLQWYTTPKAVAGVQGGMR